MLRPLPLIAVRKQQSEPGFLLPLVLGGGDVLIEYDLRAVAEVSELRFPQHERITGDNGIAVLESEHALFREGAIEDLKNGLLVLSAAKLRERRPGLPGLRVIHHGVALAERA